VPSVGIARVGFIVRSSRTIRAVTWTDSGFSGPCWTLYTVDLIGPDGFLSIIDAEDEGRVERPPWREADNPFGEVSRGDDAKNEDLRWATDELGALKVAAAGFTEADSRLVFSARALILWEMPEETLIFLGADDVSDFGGGGQPPDTLRAGCSGEGREILG
jgi:hypothetical protein